jgi:hypothetical protein
MSVWKLFSDNGQDRLCDAPMEDPGYFSCRFDINDIRFLLNKIYVKEHMLVKVFEKSYMSKSLIFIGLKRALMLHLN